MYYNNEQEDDLGFDAFIAPDDFDRHVQPVDIYEVFKYWYPLNNQARYIYYYSDGNYPLTLTPTADEYYKYGYEQGGIGNTVDVPLNGSPVTIFGETLTTKRWVIVYRPSTAKFIVNMLPVLNAVWMYVSTYVTEIYISTTFNLNVTSKLKYIHYANINSFKNTLTYAFSYNNPALVGRLTLPETVSSTEDNYFKLATAITLVTLPNTKNIPFSWEVGYWFMFATTLVEFNMGASTTAANIRLNDYINLARVSVSPQNTAFSSFNNCDIIYTKTLDSIKLLAPKTIRGLTLPDQLPQAQITALGTKLSTNIMQGYPLYIGTLITDITNLYLSNKSFTTVEVGVGNTAFSVSGNMLLNATQTNIIKVGTSNLDLIIPDATQTVNADAFLRCSTSFNSLYMDSSLTSFTGQYLSDKSFSVVTCNPNSSIYSVENGMLRTATNLIKVGTSNTGNLTIPNVTTIDAGAFLRCSGYTGNLTIPSSVTTIASGVFNGLSNLTSLTLPANYDTAMYSLFGFANFSPASLNASILNLMDGTVGAPKYFYISKTSLDALNVAYPNAVSNAALRYVNVKAGIVQDSSLKLWLDAGNTLSYPGSGTVWSDLSGSANNGTLVNGVAYNSANGGVMSFDGVNDYVNFTNPILCKSFSCWINFWNVSTTAYFLGTTEGASGGGIRYNGTSFIVYHGGNIATITTVNWAKTNAMVNFVAIDKTGGFWDLYINNVFIGTSFTQVDGFLFIVSMIGNRPSQSFYFNGQLNDTLIYNRALTAAEVTQNFNATRSKYGL